jgi:hypothetical protein
MDGRFRQSDLMRPKWDERHYANGETYGEHTITKALALESGDQELIDKLAGLPPLEYDPQRPRSPSS